MFGLNELISSFGMYFRMPQKKHGRAKTDSFTPKFSVKIRLISCI